MRPYWSVGSLVARACPACSERVFTPTNHGVRYCFSPLLLLSHLLIRPLRIFRKL